MKREKSECWKHFTIEGREAICNFCGSKLFKNPSRMPVHLLKCDSCPEDIKERLSFQITKSCLNMVKEIPVMSPIIAARGLPTKAQKRGSSSSAAILTESEDRDFDQKRIRILNVDDSWNEGQILQEEVVEDEFSKFGDCVAHKLRSIVNPQARSIAEYYINTILFRAEMTNFTSEPVIPSCDEFPLFDKIVKSEHDLVEEHEQIEQVVQFSPEQIDHEDSS